MAEATKPGLERLEDRFIVAAILIVVCIITNAVGGDNRIGQLVLVVVESLTLVVIMHASRVARGTRRVISLVIAVAALGTAVSLLLDRHSVGAGILGATLAFVGPVVIVRRIRNHAKIDVETVAASLCIYLLFGLFFSYVFRIMNDLEGQFFVEKVTATSVDFIYFSFTTLTTTGYGDLTAKESLGKMIAISEALLGQLYLVTVLALLISRYGATRRPTQG